MLAKLSELLFVETVRRYADTLPDDEIGWLAGLRDLYVARALTLFHRDIARSWTIDGLGREVGLSRSALGERFTRLIGMAPMHYLANWRMQVAAQKLRDGSESLAVELRVARAINLAHTAGSLDLTGVVTVTSGSRPALRIIVDDATVESINGTR